MDMLFVVFVCLLIAKLGGFVTISWVLVTLPLWIHLAIAVSTSIIVATCRYVEKAVKWIKK